MKTLNETLKWGRFLMIAGAVSLTVASCNLDNDDPTPTDPASNPPTPSFTDGFGTLAAVKTVTTFDPGFGVPVQEIVLGLGSAGFTDGANYNQLLNAGSVTLEGESLSQFDNGAYAYQPNNTNPTGIDFDGNPSWEVSGSGDIPAISHTTNIGFPTLGAITSSTTIPGSGDYTLTVANVAGADSVWFMLGGVVHVEGPNSTSSVFTEAEINGMGTGANFAQVAPYKFETATFSGKLFYFVTETVKTQSVTIE
ncbi:MAG: hypothetical protein H6603_03395 [Flavobacteriales bacterium]|nr:hypothetical protein [Flavobacteriales bacterium]MCB9191373.1 hypothetical protein [Flavobacteriales bacterium]MCB9204002.1 hypothetical protein [Flavobacteriales bacterium]